MADTVAPQASTPIALSDHTLDTLYSIRRTMVGQYNLWVQLADRKYETAYYKVRVESLDKAIACYIEAYNVPIEHTEKHASLDNVRVPGTGF